MRILPAKMLRGTIKLPGDKSISHRAAMLAAMAVGETRIDSFNTAEDCRTTVKCLEDLGVDITQRGTEVLVKGVGKTGFRQPEKPLDCGNSGTTMRLLSGILAGQDLESILIGDGSLDKRPMHRIVDPLEKMGARIQTDRNKPPLFISGKHPLRAIEYSQVVASAQIKSCILLAGLNAAGETAIIEPVQTRDHTERMLKWFGVDVQYEKVDTGVRVAISGKAALAARNLTIPSDISSAAFFMVAAVCLENSDIELPDVGINPTRNAIFDLLCSLGADATIVEPSVICNEPVGTIRVRGGLLEAEIAVGERCRGSLTGVPGRRHRVLGHEPRG